MKSQQTVDGGAQDYLVLHADLFVRSMSTALEFYCTKLGFSVADDALFRGPVVWALSDGWYDAARLVLVRVSRVGAMIELVEFQQGSTLKANLDQFPIRTGWVSILVSDLRAHIAALLRRDVHPASDIFTIELSRSGSCEAVFYRDPDGNGLEFLQMRS